MEAKKCPKCGGPLVKVQIPESTFTRDPEKSEKVKTGWRCHNCGKWLFE